jgi:putative sugar O-methyltransferase
MKKLKNFFNASVFSSTTQFRSDSDDGTYLKDVKKFLDDYSSFKNFKRFKNYNKILEHLSFETGKKYLDLIYKRDKSFISKGLILHEMDKLGNPVKYIYGEMNFSPTTLRYIKVTQDIKLLFGGKFKSIVEIGGGYGGQLIANDIYLKIDNYTVFDLDDVNMLIKKYVNSFFTNLNFNAISLNQYKVENIDLVISNYAFSELPKSVQIYYLEKVLKYASRGYLTLNCLNKKDRLNKTELLKLFPEGEFIKEIPKTGDHNLIFVWGHNKKKLKDYFINT